MTVTANLHGKDLGTAGKAVAKAIAGQEIHTRGVLSRDMKGQTTLLNDDTLAGLQRATAIAIIFLMLTAARSFRLSWLLSAIPAVVAGSLILLLLSGST